MEDFAERLEALERKAQREVTQEPGPQPARPPMRLVKDETDREQRDNGDGGAEDST